MMTRFALLAVTAWVVGPGPAARLPRATLLLALAAWLFLLLLVEALVLSSQAQRIGEK